MNPNNSELIKKLASKAINIFIESKTDIEKSCWMALHEYRHGFFPSEYDIREIDEELYLYVIKEVKKQMQG